MLQKKLEAKEDELQAAPASTKSSEDFTALQQELITTKARARVFGRVGTGDDSLAP